MLSECRGTTASGVCLQALTPSLPSLCDFFTLSPKREPVHRLGKMWNFVNKLSFLKRSSTDISPGLLTLLSESFVFRKVIGLLCFAVQRNISSPQYEMYRHVLLPLSLMTFKMPANDSGLRDTSFSTKYRSDTRSARALALPSSTTCKARFFHSFPQNRTCSQAMIISPWPFRNR